MTNALTPSAAQLAPVANSAPASTRKSAAITLRTRQRSGIAGSLPVQPFATTSPLCTRFLLRPSLSAL